MLHAKGLVQAAAPETLLVLPGPGCFCLVSHVCVTAGDFITNSTNNKRTRVPRLVRIHSDELEDISSAVRRGGGLVSLHTSCA